MFNNIDVANVSLQLATLNKVLKIVRFFRYMVIFFIFK